VQKHAAPFALSASLPPAPAGPQELAAADRQSLHLVVGRSLFMDLPEKLRRVYVSNPQVLDALAASPLEVVITAKAAGTSSLVLWSNGGPPQMYTVLADVDVAGLRAALAQALPGDRVEVEAQQGRVHLSGVVDSDGAAEEAARLAGVYSKDVINALVVDPRHLPQVQLEVRIVEIDRSKLTAFGINLFSLGKNSGSTSTEQFSPPGFSSQNGSNSAVISDFLNLFYFNLPHGLGTTIKDLQTKGILEILAEPDHHSWQDGPLPGGRRVSLPHRAARGSGQRAHHHGAVPSLRGQAGVHPVGQFRRHHPAAGGARGQRPGLHQ
jgi:pilus assembly protein CpaC